MGETKEKQQPNNNEQDEQWMIRPCVLYKDEYDECSSIKGRFHQYFIFGEMLDCDQWKIDYHNCYQWQKYNSKEAYDELIKSEKERRAKRLHAHYDNIIWKKRDKPPENWNAPLPEWMQKKFHNSYLQLRNQQMKEGIEVSDLDTRCTIL